MGIRNSCCIEISSGAAREGPWSDGSNAEKSWQVLSSALAGSSHRFGRLAGSTGDSWFVAKGCPVKLHWSSCVDPLGVKTQPLVLPEALIVPAKVLQVAAGDSHVLLLAMANGVSCVFSAGTNDCGQLGHGDMSPHRGVERAFKVTEVSDNLPVGSVACGGKASFCILQNGEVFSWGRHEAAGGLGHGPPPSGAKGLPSPAPIACLRRKTRAAQIASNGSSTLCLSHLGAAFSCGSGACGLHGHGHQGDETFFKAVTGLDGIPVVQAVLAPRHALAVGKEGEVITWGLMRGAFKAETELQLVPKIIDTLLDFRIVQVAAGYEHSLALSYDGQVFAWGSCFNGALGNIPADGLRHNNALVHKVQLGDVGRFREIACGAYYSLFLVTADDEQEAKERGPDIWLCGMGVSGIDGTQWRSEATAPGLGGGRELLQAPPSGVPLQPKLLNVKRVLAKLTAR
eukprot:TRINITY_DN94915_c0_g1_i1.p1 TRINITY_DN94915_c0_g1~~TRINITY_DN94915_c0_g1_i1.p1  ORF type:complete len:456 (-),score=72.53 TRINITY_DN94915_c0_g1_i1:64-1431(-)